jgi:hypothetical protein
LRNATWVSIEIWVRENGYRSQPRPLTQTPIQIPTTASSWQHRKPTREKEAIDPVTDRSVQQHIPTPTTDLDPYPDHQRPDPPNLRWVSGWISRQTDPPNPRRTDPTKPIPRPSAPWPTKPRAFSAGSLAG